MISGTCYIQSYIIDYYCLQSNPIIPVMMMKQTHDDYIKTMPGKFFRSNERVIRIFGG